MPDPVRCAYCLKEPALLRRDGSPRNTPPLCLGCRLWGHGEWKEAQGLVERIDAVTEAERAIMRDVEAPKEC